MVSAGYYSLDVGGVQMEIDLSAERLIVAERRTEKIAVEVKSFLSPSAISEFHTALGQFINYRAALRLKEPERILYLAVARSTYRNFFTRPFPRMMIEDNQVKLLVFHPQKEEIVQWIN
ncbi:MAG: element excision factor XisH family protein [Leptolyngbya sp. IPPAS B-1204]